MYEKSAIFAVFENYFVQGIKKPPPEKGRG
jgi:hypothetical protein